MAGEVSGPLASTLLILQNILTRFSITLPPNGPDFASNSFFRPKTRLLTPVWKCTRESRAAIHKFLCVETASTLLYAKETTTAQLWRQFCFPDRLVILNEDRILSNDQEKGFCRNSRKCSDCRAFSFFKTLPQLPGIWPQCCDHYCRSLVLSN